MADRPQPSYVHQALALFAEFGDRLAIVNGAQRLTYTDIHAQICGFTTTLLRHGVRPGAAVLLSLGNPVEGPLLQLALHLIGCRTMWIAPVTSHREIKEFVALAQPDALLYDARDPANVGAELAAGLGDRPVLRLGVDLVPAPAAADLPIQVPAAESLLQTSGTTGTPKLVRHQESFYTQVLALAAGFRTAGLPLLRHLSYSPMWLASGQITTLFNLFTGGVLFPREGWDAVEFIQTVPAEQITSTFLTPPMLYEVLDHPTLPGADFTSMFMFNVGAGPAAPARLRQAITRFGPVLRIVYGLSEAVVVTAQPGLTEDPAHPERLYSCGEPYGDVRIEIRGPDGDVLPPDVDGEVWVQTALRFAGYHGNPDLTADTLVDGWVRTRDVGHLDVDGYLYLVDRLQDRILTRRRSWPIYSRPIEDALAGHPDVRAAAVIGVPDEVAGELPWAYVVPRPGAAVTAAELIDVVTAALSDTWAPGGVEFVAALPLNRANKVDKRVLRARHAASHPSAVEHPEASIGRRA
ncbi:class I adenylate-forming enzyme family protein [Salinispora oceanensis]|uniref:class I adenylate-forming enzyme family protein n=1 Tax=Salinispora oceanensis TaxID=1050199 RepID=UPI00035E02A5|nr:AMP-binding protein [Salinispora oceanensis]